MTQEKFTHRKVHSTIYFAVIQTQGFQQVSIHWPETVQAVFTISDAEELFKVCVGHPSAERSWAYMDVVTGNLEYAYSSEAVGVEKDVANMWLYKADEMAIRLDDGRVDYGETWRLFMEKHANPGDPIPFRIYAIGPRGGLKRESV